MIFRLCVHCEQNGENAPLSTTVPDGGLELVRTVIGNSLVESKTLQVYTSKSTLGICREITTTLPVIELYTLPCTSH